MVVRGEKIKRERNETEKKEIEEWKQMEHRHRREGIDSERGRR